MSSTLVATLVALPIAGMTAFLIISMSSIATPAERVVVELGRMQAWIKPLGVPDAGFWQVPSEPEWNGYPIDADGAMTIPDGTPIPDPTTVLPPGTDTIALTEGTATVRTRAGSAVVPAWAGPAWEPRFEGAFTIVAGERPDGEREAMATPAALERLGVGLGGQLHLTGIADPYTLVGTLEAATLADDDAAVFLPSAARAHVGGATRWYLPEDELSWPQVQELNEDGVVAFSREVVLDPPRFTNRFYSSPASTDRWATMWPLVLLLTVAGLFAGYVVVMLAGAAFAVAARRQQRSLAVAAGVGADRGDLSRIILFQGATLGLVGGAAGVGAGVGFAALVMLATSDGRATQFWGLHVPWELLAAVLVFAVVVGTVSAWMPARRVARSDALQALRGARRPQRPVASRPVWGSILLAGGVAITLLSALAVATINATDAVGYDSAWRYIPAYGIVVGPVLAQFGILMSGPWMLSMCSRGLSKLGTAPKLASRDAAANPSRTVPAFAAIAATVFLGVFALGQSSMQSAQTARLWFYQAPVGSIAVSIWPGSAATTGALAGDQAEDAASAAVHLAEDAGAEDVAVLARQQLMWVYRTPDEIPDEAAVSIARLPDRYLLDPESGASFTSQGQDPSNPITVVAADQIETALGVDLPASELYAYRAGAAIVADGRFVTDGAITVETYRGLDQYEGRVPDNIFHRHPDAPRYARPVASQRIDAITVAAPLQSVIIAVTPETAERLGMRLAPERVVATTPEPLTQEARDRMQSRAEVLSTPDFTLSPTVEGGPPGDAVWVVPLLTAVCVLVLGASAVALGLARFERRPDDATLAAVGATRSLRRRIGFWQGLIIAGFGTAAGAVTGVLPAIGFSIQSGGTQRVDDIPWWLITGLVLALPLAIAVVNGIVPPRHPELTRRTVIT
ncbi:FtsX-like permease family protein [Microbacterium timonense]|uniref:FtsX-like permease family protein n=1 Tax=Microbacterium timonense TaxID=2086576 RepID=UPI001F212095|nr:FtsX-like permease family protein [Microbacterium timonense]